MKNWDWGLFIIYFLLLTGFLFFIFWILNLFLNDYDDSVPQMLFQSAFISFFITLIVEGFIKKEFLKKRGNGK